MSLARNIKSIFLTEDEIQNKANNIKDRNYKDEEKLTIVRQEMVDKFNNCLGLTAGDTGSLTRDDWKKLELKDDKTSDNEYYYVACSYYEYMQFKKAIFKCNNIEYDVGNTGRVKKIEFEFTGKIR